MVLQMARPQKNSKSGVYYFRQKTPAALVALTGKKEVSWSLGTKDPEEAKVRNAAAVQKQALIWARCAKQPEPLPQQQIVALSGVLYREIMTGLELEPGAASLWQEVLKLLDRVAASPDGLSKWYGSTADNLLLEHGIVTDDYSRTRLLQALDHALRQAAEQQLKRAEFDYSPDPKANRFPALSAPVAVPPKVASEGLTIRAAFILWERDHLANGKSARTVGDFRHKVESLITFVEHDDAQRVSSENIADWCDHLRHEEGKAARTVSQKYLAVAKLVFGLAVEKRKLKENPAASVKVRYAKPQKTRASGYTDAEAKIILTAALADPESLGGRSGDNKRAIRWGPWICAFTGARITEAMQIRTDDLLFEIVDGQSVPYLRFTPAAGSVKSGNYRIVPIHPQLQEMGLVSMIRALPPGPVFYSMEFKRKEADPVRRARNAGAKVWEWIRDDVKITDARVQPNHAWRHRFKTLARDADIAHEYMDVIQGHEDGRAASDYGETTLKALWREIQKLPRYNIAGASIPQ